MKLYCGAVGLATLSLFFSAPVFSQHYYVVAGAYATATGAEVFTDYVESKGFQASFLRNAETSLYYVFVLQTNDHDKAYTYVRWMQRETEFRDAWVYHGQLKEEAPASVEAEPLDTPALTRLADTRKEKTEVHPEITIEVQEEIITPDASPEPLVLKDPAEDLSKPKGKFFKFNIITPDGELLSEKIHYVDLKRGIEVNTFKSGEYVDVLRPRTPYKRKNNKLNRHQMTLICGVFGYEEVWADVDYNDPSQTEGAYMDEKGVWVIPFYLKPLQKGDVSLMYNLEFYKDAVVMLPKSKSDLDRLVEMMTENPGYAIKVHGHCNGGHDRKIIALGGSRNYFDIAGSDELNGSARELSMLRAESIRSYLVDNGVEPHRILVRPWGGRDMLVYKDGPASKLNDRIEIEILRD